MENLQEKAQALREMVNSPGWKVLMAGIDEQKANIQFKLTTVNCRDPLLVNMLQQEFKTLRAFPMEIEKILEMAEEELVNQAE